MKVYGSIASPFARKLRIVFNELESKIPQAKCEFVAIDFFNADRQKLKELSPIMKVPVLEWDGKILYDSRVIFNELVSRGWLPAFNWDQQNTLSIIDGVMDSYVNILLLRRSKMDLDPTSVLGTSHGERISLSLAVLEKAVEKNQFQNWDFLAISLYALIDWAIFRELNQFKEYPALLKFYAAQKNRPSIQATDPRL